MTCETKSPRILVCGGNGNLGRAIFNHLLTQIERKSLIVGSRSPNKLADLQANGVEVIRIDFDDTDTLIQGFKNIDKLVLISPGSDPTRLRRRAQMRLAIRTAERVSRPHIVYTSLCGAAEAAEPSVFDEHWQVEEDLRQSDMSWTILRNGLYIDQFAASLPLALQYGIYSVVSPFAPVAYISRNDCALAVCDALTSSFNGRRHLTLTGDTPVSRLELVSFVANGLSVPVKVKQLDPKDYCNCLLKVGLWKHVVDAIMEIECAIDGGTYSRSSDDLYRTFQRRPENPFSFLQSRFPALLSSVRALEAGRSS